MSYRLDAHRLGELFDLLRADDYRLLGPTRRDGAIVYSELQSVADLPQGWTDRQEAGRYRLERRGDDAYFGYVVGPQSWKRVFLPPSRRLWKAGRDEQAGFTVTPDALPDEPLALIGVRACELAAIRVQDRVLRDGPVADPYYAARREKLFVVAVNCVEAGGTCFCVSMQTGPHCTDGFDLSLTEVVGDGEHWFHVAAGTPAGDRVVERLAMAAASDTETATAAARIDACAAQMGREMDTVDLHDLLLRQFESPHWDDVGSRCLSCTNCTLVCPTCFCTAVEDATDLTGTTAERHRRWDSCFTPGHSEVHGGPVRQSTPSRYRQWLTHKLATWIDQFGTSGCVGCGRCITWCPVGIDITAEAAALRELDGDGQGGRHGRDTRA